jgi:hypothetical protein
MLRNWTDVRGEGCDLRDLIWRHGFLYGVMVGSLFMTLVAWLGR